MSFFNNLIKTTVAQCAAEDTATVTVDTVTIETVAVESDDSAKWQELLEKNSERLDSLRKEEKIARKAYKSFCSKLFKAVSQVAAEEIEKDPFAREYIETEKASLNRSYVINKLHDEGMELYKAELHALPIMNNCREWLADNAYEIEDLVEQITKDTWKRVSAGTKTEKKNLLDEMNLCYREVVEQLRVVKALENRINAAGYEIVAG